MCWTAQWNEGKNGYHVRVPLHETFGISSRRPHENMRNCKTHVQRVCIYCERAKSVSVLSVWVYRVIELSVRTWSCRACALIVFANFITLLILLTLCYSNKSSTLLLLFVKLQLTVVDLTYLSAILFLFLSILELSSFQLERYSTSFFTLEPKNLHQMP